MKIFSGHARQINVSLNRRRSLLKANAIKITKLSCLLTWIFYIFRVSHSDTDIDDHGVRSSRSSSKDPFQACTEAPIRKLVSFDPFTVSCKMNGFRCSQIESRRTQVPWEILVDRHKIFTIDRDDFMNISTYHPSLPSDIRGLEKLAELIDPLPNISGGGSDYFSRHRKRAVSIVNIYRRLDRLRGLQYVMLYRFKKPQKNSGWLVALHVQHPMGSDDCNMNVAYFRDFNSIQSKPDRLKFRSQTPLYILLPYKNRREKMKLFLQHFAHLRKLKMLNIILIVSVLRLSEDIEVINVLKREVIGYNDPEISKAIWISENDGDSDRNFSRSVSLREAARMVPDTPNSSSPVMLLCDVDLVLKATFLRRCHLNSIPGSQVYFPIFYNMYAHERANSDIGPKHGYWRASSLGMVCIHKHDFFTVDAFHDAETRFHGWGLEDVYLYEKIYNSSHLTAFRAIEPGLLHRWHGKHCQKDLSDYDSCINSQLEAIGHPTRIAKTINGLLPELGISALLAQHETKSIVDEDVI